MTIKQLKEAIRHFPDDAIVTIKGSQKVMEGVVVIEQDEEDTRVYDASKDSKRHRPHPGVHAGFREKPVTANGFNRR